MSSTEKCEPLNDKAARSNWFMLELPLAWLQMQNGDSFEFLILISQEDQFLPSTRNTLKGPLKESLCSSFNKSVYWREILPLWVFPQIAVHQEWSFWQGLAVNSAPVQQNPQTSGHERQKSNPGLLLLLGVTST